MNGAYASSGVDTGSADRAVAALVGVLKTIDTGRPSRSVLSSGHYAAVLEVAPNLGIAVGTDGVGSKLIVAEQTRRYDTVGIDCIAMNVNDVVCVGAEPFARARLPGGRARGPRRDARDRDRPEGGRGGRGRGDPGRRGRGAAGADPRPPVAARLRPHGGLLRDRRARRAGDRRRVRAGRRADRPALVGPALQRLLAGPPGAARRRRPAALGPARGARRLVGGRRAARADRDLRARGARAAALGRPGPRARPHHRRRAAEPPAAARRRRLRDRRPAAGPAGVRARPRARPRERGRDVGGLQHGLRVLRRRPRGLGRRRRRDPRPPPPRRPPDRHRHRRRRPHHRARRSAWPAARTA